MHLTIASLDMIIKNWIVFAVIESLAKNMTCMVLSFVHVWASFVTSDEIEDVKMSYLLKISLVSDSDHDVDNDGLCRYFVLFMWAYST